MRMKGGSLLSKLTALSNIQNYIQLSFICHYSTLRMHNKEITSLVRGRNVSTDMDMNALCPLSTLLSEVNKQADV